MRAGGEHRGSARDRRERCGRAVRFFGNGETCPCLLRIHPLCEGRLDVVNVTIDRLIPGSWGGKYVWGNWVPACIRCNDRRKDKPLHAVMSRRRVQTLMDRLERAIYADAELKHTNPAKGLAQAARYAEWEAAQ